MYFSMVLGRLLLVLTMVSYRCLAVPKGALSTAELTTAASEWTAGPAAATTKWGDISDWDVSAVTSMISTFNGAAAFNGNISAWYARSLLHGAALCHAQATRAERPPHAHGPTL